MHTVQLVIAGFFSNNYLEMADADAKRREAHASFIRLQRAYDLIVDKAFKIA